MVIITVLREFVGGDNVGPAVGKIALRRRVMGLRLVACGGGSLLVTLV
jgi:hypothetical protein